MTRSRLPPSSAWLPKFLAVGAGTMLAAAGCTPSPVVPAQPDGPQITGASCQGGARWEPGRCVAVEVVCPEGAAWKSERRQCVGDMGAACPEGATFVEGTGCVGRATPVASDSPSPADDTPLSGAPVLPPRSTGATPPRALERCASDDLMCNMRSQPQPPATTRPAPRCDCAPSDLTCHMRCNEQRGF